LRLIRFYASRIGLRLRRIQIQAQLDCRPESATAKQQTIILLLIRQCASLPGLDDLVLGFHLGTNRDPYEVRKLRWREASETLGEVSRSRVRRVAGLLAELRVARQSRMLEHLKGKLFERIGTLPGD